MTAAQARAGVGAATAGGGAAGPAATARAEEDGCRRGAPAGGLSPCAAATLGHVSQVNSGHGERPAAESREVRQGKALTFTERTSARVAGTLAPARALRTRASQGRKRARHAVRRVVVRARAAERRAGVVGVVTADRRARVAGGASAAVRRAGAGAAAAPAASPPAAAPAAASAAAAAAPALPAASAASAAAAAARYAAGAVESSPVGVESAYDPESRTVRPRCRHCCTRATATEPAMADERQGRELQVLRCAFITRPRSSRSGNQGLRRTHGRRIRSCTPCTLWPERGAAVRVS